MFMSQERREREMEIKERGREMGTEKYRESDRERERRGAGEGRVREGRGGEEKGEEGEQMYIFVLLNCWPAALSPSQLAFCSLRAQIHFATYMSSQSQLIYTIAIHPDGVTSPCPKACLWGSRNRVRKGSGNGFRGPEILSLTLWINHQPHQPLSKKVREEKARKLSCYLLFFLFLLHFKGKVDLCPTYGAWNEMLPCGVRKASGGAEPQLGHLAGWSFTSSCQRNHGQRLLPFSVPPPLSGVPLLAEIMKPPLAPYGRSRVSRG